MFLHRYICLTLLLSCLFSEAYSQFPVTHNKNITALSIDSLGYLLLKDERAYHGLTGRHLSRKPEAFAPVIKKPEFEIDQGRLRKNLGDNFSFYPLPFTPLAVAPQGGILLCSSAEGLWTVDSGQAKRLYIPGQKFPENIVEMKTGEGMIAMLTADKNLFVYDTNRQLVQLVNEKVDHFAIDKWNCLWYNQDRWLRQDTTYLNNHPPTLTLVRITDAYGKTYTDPINLEKEMGALLVHYEGSYPPSYDELQYSYSLDGGEWQACAEGMAIVRGITSGNHELVFRAASSDEVVTLTKPIRIKVKSENINWLWPLLFGGLFLLGIATWFSQQRMQRSLTKLAAEKEKILMELQLANEKQKTGQLQMNPHFIFNTLNSISGLIALNENKLARTQLNKFSKMIRSVLSSSMKEYVPVEEELNFLEDYLSLEKLIRNDKFSFTIDSDVSETKMVPPMILQPFLENAIVHGLNKKAEEGQLRLQLEDQGKFIKATIEDNGIGREAALQQKKEGHESAALDIIEERLKALNKWNDIGLVYTDLKDAQGRASGTRVTLHLPIQNK